MVPRAWLGIIPLFMALVPSTLHSRVSSHCWGSIGTEVKFQGSRTTWLRRSLGTQATLYRVLLKMPSGEKMISCPDYKSILDAAEDANVELPFSCRAGSCPSCAGKLEMGSVDQGGNTFMEYEHIDQGFILTCVAYPTSDLVVVTHTEDELVASLLL